MDKQQQPREWWLVRSGDPNAERIFDSRKDAEHLGRMECREVVHVREVLEPAGAGDARKNDAPPPKTGNEAVAPAGLPSKPAPGPPVVRSFPQGTSPNRDGRAAGVDVRDVAELAELVSQSISNFCDSHSGWVSGEELAGAKKIIAAALQAERQRAEIWKANYETLKAFDSTSAAAQRAEAAEARVRELDGEVTHSADAYLGMLAKVRAELQARLAESEAERDKLRLIVKASGSPCEVCWTCSWEPAQEGDEWAVQFKDGSEWTVCGHCRTVEFIRNAQARLAESEAGAGAMRKALQRYASREFWGTTESGYYTHESGPAVARAALRMGQATLAEQPGERAEEVK